MPAGPDGREGQAGADGGMDAGEALRLSEARFRATFEQAAVGMAHVGLDGRFLLVNQKLCDIVGYTPAQLRTLTFQDITHRDDLHADVEQATRLAAGEIASYSMEKRYVRRDHSIVWVRLTVSCVRRADGSPGYFVSVMQDIDRQKRAEESLRFLVEAGRVLTQSLDMEVVLATLLRLVVPRLADYAIVDLLDEQGRHEGSRTSHARPEKVPIVREYRRRFPPSPQGGRSVIWQVVASGEPFVIHDISDAALADLTAEPAQAEFLRTLRPRACVTLPLVAPGHTLGTLSLCLAESDRRFGDEDVAIARELASRAAVAIDHARLLARLRRAADAGTPAAGSTVVPG